MQLLVVSYYLNSASSSPFDPNILYRTLFFSRRERQPPVELEFCISYLMGSLDSTWKTRFLKTEENISGILTQLANESGIVPVLRNPKIRYRVYKSLYLKGLFFMTVRARFNHSAELHNPASYLFLVLKYAPRREGVWWSGGIVPRINHRNGTWVVSPEESVLQMAGWEVA